jgi:hypothetical protein
MIILLSSHLSARCPLICRPGLISISLPAICWVSAAIIIFADFFSQKILPQKNISSVQFARSRLLTAYYRTNFADFFFRHCSRKPREISRSKSFFPHNLRLSADSNQLHAFSALLDSRPSLIPSRDFCS